MRASKAYSCFLYVGPRTFVENAERIREDMYPRLREHFVEYTASKAECEMLLENTAPELPLVVARLSVVVGHSAAVCRQRAFTGSTEPATPWADLRWNAGRRSASGLGCRGCRVLAFRRRFATAAITSAGEQARNVAEIASVLHAAMGSGPTILQWTSNDLCARRDGAARYSGQVTTICSQPCRCIIDSWRSKPKSSTLAHSGGGHGASPS
jgi:nucleoside-diphosphate-sugar epimerase